MNAKASLLGAFLLAAGVAGACSSKTENPPTQTKGETVPPGGGGSSGGGGTTDADSGTTTTTEPDGAVVKVCNSTTCNGGCCDATGTCQGGTLVTQCGQNGNPCLACTNTQTTCIAGNCE
jgi:hypothetical protein